MTALLSRTLAALLALSLAAPTSAFAQPSASATATADARAADLKKRGDELLESKRYAEALDAYDAAYAAAPSPTLLYNRGRALQFLARYPEALSAIEQFAAEAPPDLRARVPGLDALLTDLRGRVGTLAIRCDVAGARVLIGDKQIGVTPLAPSLRVAAGHLTIDVFADGYFPLHRAVDLAGNGSATLDLKLVPRDSFGLLGVKSHVGGARIAIDGRLLGLAPVEAGLAAGSHRLLAQRDGYEDASTEVVIRAGEHRTVFLDPLARPAFYTRAWFWVAVGVVVVGGVVTYVALTTEKSATPGDYSPGIVHF